MYNYLLNDSSNNSCNDSCNNLLNNLSNDLLNNLNEITIKIFKKLGINISNIDNLIGTIIYRETLLNQNIYNDIQEDIPTLKLILKTTFFTSTQKNAVIKQNWPLLNLIRQILKIYNIYLEPKRISAGYTSNGKKKYKRLFTFVR